VNSQYAIAVLFDGNKNSTKIHSSYVEAESPESHNQLPTALTIRGGAEGEDLFETT
jgi:bacillopeptidase F (M6 metalloprotease family)